MCAFGSQDHSKILRFLCIYIFLEFPNYFTYLINRYNTNYSNFEKFILDSSRDGVWGGNVARAALSIIFNRPIWVISVVNNSSSLINNANLSNKEPLVICFDHNHYNSILKINSSSSINKPSLVLDSDIEFHINDELNVFKSKLSEQRHKESKQKSDFQCPNCNAKLICDNCTIDISSSPFKAHDLSPHKYCKRLRESLSDDESERSSKKTIHGLARKTEQVFNFDFSTLKLKYLRNVLKVKLS